jgi:hypothetical protein
LKRFLGIWLLGESSEKGYTRKLTGNRVARCKEMVWGNLGALRCFTKRIGLGELEFGVFGRVVRGITWGWEEGGHLWCFKNV